MKHPTQKPIVDGHLDLAENVTLFGRDLTQPVETIRAGENRERNQATVSLPALRRGGIAVALATVTPGFLAEDVGPDFEPRSALYRTAEEAQANALAQIDLYERWERQGEVRLIRSASDLAEHLRRWRQDRVTGLVLLMESADPIVQPADLPAWWQRGLRLIGLTFGDTRYGAGVAGGAARPKEGGLTADGLELLYLMADLGFIWDVSHLTEAGIHQGLALNFPRICATHVTAQKLTPTNRHLSDEIMVAIARQGGILGLVLYNGFLDHRWPGNHTIPVTVADQVRRHAHYIGDLVGWRHLGIGSDLDGGFGRDECPQEINSVADLRKIGPVLPERARDNVLGGNWLRFLRNALPQQ